MSDKPFNVDKALEKLMPFSLLVGKFEKMQLYNMEKSNAIFLSFEIENWRTDHPCLKKDLELFAEHYPLINQYIQRMDQVFEKQDKYRQEHGLQSVEDWWKEERLRSERGREGIKLKYNNS